MMYSKLRLLAGAAAVLFSLGAIDSRAAPQQDITDGQSNGKWFIELSGSVESFRSNAARSGVQFNERFVYKRLWKGLSVEASAENISLIKGLQGVAAVYPVLNVPRPETQPAAPELAYALGMTGADVAQNELALSGAGIKVGVIDTGIDYHHPDLGGGFGAGYRVIAGYDFVGDRYDAGGSGGALIAHPDNNPDDCNGHGTHVAGIVGASGNPATGGARGVAPGVKFGAYRVFGCDGSTDSDIMIAAMEMALADGMNVVNMSIGAAFQTWPGYPTAVAADALVDAGVVVVTSIGNSGASGVYSASAPGVGKKVIGVASVDNVKIPLPYFTISPDDTPIGYSQGASAGIAPTSGSAAMARTGNGTATANDACIGTTLPDLTNKVALIRRGTCGFYEKSRRAQLAGAIGVVIYNNVAGRVTPNVAVSTGADGLPVTIPVVSVSDTEGLLINTRLAAGPVTMTWTDDTADFPNSTGGLASSFTSFGLSADLDLKPDISAPGGFIRSTVPMEQGGYAVISGTSMASPHVAGAAALYLESHRSASPADVRVALQNTARRYRSTLSASFLEYVHRQGAGMVDIPAAATAAVKVTPSKIALGENGSAPKVITMTVTNSGASAVTYNLSVSGALTSGGTFVVSAFGPVPVASVSPSSVTVPAGGSATFTATFQPVAAQGFVYGGFLVLTPTAGTSQALSVPYAGFAGDYQLVQVLAPGGCSFPGVFKLGGSTACSATTGLDIAVTRQAADAVFNVEDRNDRPVLLYHRAHQSQRIEIRALDVATNESHLVAWSDLVSRNAANGTSYALGGFSAYTWDGKRVFTNAAGKVQRKELPSGSYKLQVVVTKALAEAGNPAHVETWTSPTLVITR